MLYTNIFCMKLLDSDVLNIVRLYNVYGNLLTENQSNILSLFYDCDCSLAEIAEQYGVSRQAVRDTIKKAELTLLNLEEKLGILSKMKKINAIAKDSQQNLSNTELLDKSLKTIVEITEV